MTKKGEKGGYKGEIRFDISNQTENLVKEICRLIGLKESQLGKIALIEYIRGFSFDGKL